MARVRSPNYPAIGLPEAVERLKALFAKVQHRTITREQAAEAMGFEGLHGGSLGALSALLKFGLLQKSDNGVRVSDRGLAIIAPQTDDERPNALVEAAFDPPLFNELHDRFLGEVPNDDKLRSYLIRKQFSSSALDRVVRSFRETMELVSEEIAEYNAQPGQVGTNAMRDRPQPLSDQAPPRFATPGHGAPFRVSFEGDAIEITGRLTTPEDIDKLVRFLELNKVMITPSCGPISTEYTDDEEGREAERRDNQMPPPDLDD